ncbi:MAG: glutamine amidotransferase [Candidatus Omnitrophota bacterium]|nr:glutamine amidotransferase [Candidatus Omnitrophota bacterium]
MPKRRILYAGDSTVDGPARYLLGIIKSLPVECVHVPPAKKIPPRMLKRKFDAIILSDYSKTQLPAASEKAIIEQVRAGTGFMMVGGWGSFSGPFGGWRDSGIEKLLPVRCRTGDDRVNFPGGAHIMAKDKHPCLRELSFKNPPAICGLNDVSVKKSGRILLTAREIVSVGSRLTLDPVECPLLVVDGAPAKRIAAFTTDFAPHWCGGLVDWGGESRVYKVSKSVAIEVGKGYARLVSGLLCWLVRL